MQQDHYEEFTDTQLKILEKYVTNTSGHIFVLRNLPEVIKGALFSRYSRSNLGLRIPSEYDKRTAAFKELYDARAGVEGTLSQGLRVCDLRHARYIGLAKTHLQHVLTAAALNLVRAAQWIEEPSCAATRSAPFLALLPQAA